MESTPKIPMADLRPYECQLRPAQVLVFGHSFVRRLNQDLIKKIGQYHNLGIDYNLAQINWLGIGGMSTKQARMEQLIVIQHLKPDVVYIELGTLDLLEKRPESVASEIHDLVLDILSLDVKRVTVGQVIYRDESEDLDSQETEEFNGRVYDCNHYLGEFLQPHFTPGSRLWKHKGFWNSAYPLLMDDGLHLNTMGTYRLYRSIRGAVLQSVYSIPELFTPFGQLNY